MLTSTDNIFFEKDDQFSLFSYSKNKFEMCYIQALESDDNLQNLWNKLITIKENKIFKIGEIDKLLIYCDKYCF